MAYDQDIKTLVTKVTKEIAEALNNMVCSDYAEIKAYNKLKIYPEHFILEVTVRLSAENASQ